MKKKLINIFIFLFTISFYNSYSQNKVIPDSSDLVTDLFKSQTILPLKLNYSNKNIKKTKDDTTYLKTNMSYQNSEGIWNDINVEIRKRGNFRLKNCHYSPIKISIKKSSSKGTLFEGNKKLKLVLPCSTNNDKNDYILIEYITYKLYELISNYHFKTRIVSISYSEIIRNKTKNHFLKGFLIEDVKTLAKRNDCEIIERSIHPLNQDALTSVRHAFFQFMIGCTDFSTAYQHNGKLLFKNNRILTIPYDFDMSGFVNPRYAVNTENSELGITSLKERVYRGFKRDPLIIQQVRQEFLDNKIKFMEEINSYEANFDSPKLFLKAKNYILDFYSILENNVQFQNEITSKLRTK